MSQSRIARTCLITSKRADSRTTAHIERIIEQILIENIAQLVRSETHIASVETKNREGRLQESPL